MAPTIAPHVLYAKIDQAAGTTTDVVADPGDGRQVVLLGVALSSDTTGTAKFHDDTGGGSIDLTGEMNLLAGSPLVVGFTNFPILKCTASQKLQLTTTQECNGWIAYTIDTA